MRCKQYQFAILTYSLILIKSVTCPYITKNTDRFVNLCDPEVSLIGKLNKQTNKYKHWGYVSMAVR
jgi:hypothetical protein